MNGHFPFGDIQPSRYFFGSAALIGLLFSFIGEETEQPYLLNLLQWQLQTLLPMGMLILIHLGLANLPWIKNLNAWLKVLLSGLVASAVFTPIALSIEIMLGEDGLNQDIIQSLVGEFFGMSPPVILSWLLLNAPWLLGGTYVKPSNKQNQQANQLGESRQGHTPAFYQLIAAEKRGELLAISAELHYIKIFTDQGNSLILYSLRDAVADLPESLGMQIHRSYWANYKIIKSYRKQGRQGQLTLSDGETLPVSRTYIPKVLAWLEHHKNGAIAA